MPKRKDPSNKECIELINAFTGTVYRRLLIKETVCPKADNDEDESAKNRRKQHEI